MSFPRLQLPERLSRWLRPSYPGLAVEFDAHRVVGVRVERERGRVRLVSHASRELEPGSLELQLLQPNLQQREHVRGQLRELLQELGARGQRISLVLQDRVVKVALIRLEDRPRSLDETRDLIVWKLKKTTPFRIEEARLSYQSLPTQGSGAIFMVLVGLEAVIGQYEELARSLELEPGLIDISSLNVFNLFHQQLMSEVGDGDALQLNLGTAYFTALISRAGQPIFYRCKSLLGGQDVVSAVLAEVHPTRLYYLDKLGGRGFARIYLRGPREQLERLQEQLAERYGLEAEPLDNAQLLPSLPSEPDQRDSLTPVLGAACGR